MKSKKYLSMILLATVALTPIAQASAQKPLGHSFLKKVELLKIAGPLLMESVQLANLLISPLLKGTGLANTAQGMEQFVEASYHILNTINSIDQIKGQMPSPEDRKFLLEQLAIIQEATLLIMKDARKIAKPIAKGIILVTKRRKGTETEIQKMTEKVVRMINPGFSLMEIYHTIVKKIIDTMLSLTLQIELGKMGYTLEDLVDKTYEQLEALKKAGPKKVIMPAVVAPDFPPMPAVAPIGPLEEPIPSFIPAGTGEEEPIFLPAGMEEGV